MRLALFLIYIANIEPWTAMGALSLLISALIFMNISESFLMPRNVHSSTLHLQAVPKEGDLPLNQVIMRIDCKSVSPDEFTDMLFELGVASVSIEMERTWTQIGNAASWDTALVKAHIPNTFDTEQLLDVVRDSKMPFELQEVVGIEDKDWISEVQKNWKPEQVTKDLSIRFPWHKDNDVKTPYQLTLEAGAAFGTGGHETTRLCCKFLEELLVNSDKKNSTLLDYGCGSGILALVGLFYGCSAADGTDIDLDSLHAARRNARKNGENLQLYMAKDIDDVVEVQAIKNNGMRGTGEGTDEIFPSVSEIQGKTYDIVVANILAPILLALAEDLYAKTAPGGIIALSGVITKQGESVVQRFRGVGFLDCQVKATENEWVLITARRSEEVSEVRRV